MFRASKRSSSREIPEDNPFENIFPSRREEIINIYSPRVTNGERTKKLEKTDHSPKSFNTGPSIVNNTLQEEKPRRNNNYQSAIAPINGGPTTAADLSFQSISSDGQTMPYYTSQRREKDKRSTINGADRIKAGQDHSFKSSNSGPSTMSNAQKKNSNSKINNHPLEFMQRPKQSLSSALRDCPAWAKMMTARFDNHFKLLETQFAQMQIQIDTLTSTVNDLRYTFFDQQGIPPTDEDQTWMFYL